MTSAGLAATTSSAWLIGLSSALSRASNSSRMRISTASGSLRVTTTSGFLPDAIECLLDCPLALTVALVPFQVDPHKPIRLASAPGSLSLPHRPVQVSLTALADTAAGRWFIKNLLPDGRAPTKRAGVTWRGGEVRWNWGL